MSRALDKDVAASLKAGDPAAAYREISRALTEPGCEGLLEIEILGRSHPVPPGTNLLQEENAIAVPKLALVQAFIVARQILDRFRGEDGGGVADPNASEEEARAATAVMLLMDPEHLTAANTRKRIIQRQVTLHRPAAAALLVQDEKRFVDSLLTSRLHRHTKSPTLWSHLRWLLQLSSTSLDTPLDACEDIVNVVMVSGERHRRNYYAWCHARWLVQALSLRGSSAAAAEREKILSATKDWCYRHHTDISGWSFLYSLLFSDDATTSPEARAAVLADIARLATSLRWANESVWVFWRTAVSSQGVGPDEYDRFLATNLALREALPRDSEEGKMLRRAEDWSARHRITR